MGFCVDFTDNKSISAEELNSIKAEVGDGTVSVSSEFIEDTLYYTDKLNCIRSEIVTGGIASGCEAALCDEGVLIGEGLCFFDSGIRIKIDAEGIKLPIQAGVQNFVYLYASQMLDIATAVVTTEEKTGSEYVPICVVKENGQIADERKWCRSKIPMMNSRFIQKETVEIVNYDYGTALLAAFPLLSKAYSYILFLCRYSIGLYNKDINKYSYIITSGSYGRELVENAPSYLTGYENGSNYSCLLTVKEEDGMIKLYGAGRQASCKMDIIIF